MMGIINGSEKLFPVLVVLEGISIYLLYILILVLRSSDRIDRERLL